MTGHIQSLGPLPARKAFHGATVLTSGIIVGATNLLLHCDRTGVQKSVRESSYLIIRPMTFFLSSRVRPNEVHTTQGEVVLTLIDFQVQILQLPLID